MNIDLNYQKQRLDKYTWYMNKKNHIYISMYWENNYDAKVLYIKFYEHGVENQLEKDFRF